MLHLCHRIWSPPSFTSSGNPKSRICISAPRHFRTPVQTAPYAQLSCSRDVHERKTVKTSSQQCSTMTNHLSDDPFTVSPLYRESSVWWYPLSQDNHGAVMNGSSTDLTSCSNAQCTIIERPPPVRGLTSTIDHRLTRKSKLTNYLPFERQNNMNNNQRRQKSTNPWLSYRRPGLGKIISSLLPPPSPDLNLPPAPITHHPDMGLLTAKMTETTVAQNGIGGTRVMWLGHASVYLEIPHRDGVFGVLFDPIFAQRSISSLPPQLAQRSFPEIRR